MIDVTSGKDTSLTRRSLFTLIELLVVIAIIGILASLLLPALGKAQEMAKRTGCRSNLHNISVCLFLYADDSSGHYPPRVSSNLANWTIIDHWRRAEFWKNYIPDYNSILFCPNVFIKDWPVAYRPDGWATDTRIPYPVCSGASWHFENAGDTATADRIADGTQSKPDALIMTDAVILRPGVTDIFYTSNHPRGSYVEQETCAGGNVLRNGGSVRWQDMGEFDGVMSWYRYPTEP